MAESSEERSRVVVTETTEDLARRHAIEHTRMTLETGWLGKIFGSATNAPTNIAGLVLCLFFPSIIIVLFLEARMEAIEYLKLVLRVITLALGYLFGKST